MVSSPPPGDKLQKVLAQQGLGSRREIEQWIRDNRLKVNGKLAKLGDRVLATDRILLDGKTVTVKAHHTPTRVIAYNKPTGQICSRKDPQGRDSVFDHLPKITGSRWVMVGRLDYNTSGLLLFTTEGELAHRLMHPSYEIEREYAVRVFGALSPESAKELTDGVMLNGKLAKLDLITDAGGQGRNHWFHVRLTEGQNREIRQLFEHVGTTVSRLIRIRYAHLTLDSSLKPKQWAELSQNDINKLYRLVKLPLAPRPA